LKKNNNKAERVGFVPARITITAKFHATDVADRELRLRKGSRIRLAPASRQPEHIKGWVLASDGIKTGLVPVNYIKVMGKANGFPNAAINSATPTQNEPLTSSCSSPSVSRSSSQSTIKWSDTTQSNPTEEI